MSKSIPVLQKRRGRPATGADPLLNFRCSPEIVLAVDKWAEGQPDPKPTRSEAIRRLLEYALVDGGPKPTPSLNEQIATAKSEAASSVAGAPSPEKGMAMLRRGKAEAGLAGLEAKKKPDEKG